jgi:hypothetical protein
MPTCQELRLPHYLRTMPQPDIASLRAPPRLRCNRPSRRRRGARRLRYAVIPVPIEHAPTITAGARLTILCTVDNIRVLAALIARNGAKTPDIRHPRPLRIRRFVAHTCSRPQ